MSWLPQRAMKQEMRTGEIRLGVPGETLKVWELREAGARVILHLDPSLLLQPHTPQTLLGLCLDDCTRRLGQGQA